MTDGVPNNDPPHSPSSLTDKIQYPELIPGLFQNQDKVEKMDDGDLPGIQPCHDSPNPDLNDLIADKNALEELKEDGKAVPASDGFAKEMLSSSNGNLAVPTVEELKEELVEYKKGKLNPYQRNADSPVLFNTKKKVYLLNKNWHRKWKKYVTGRRYAYHYMGEDDLVPVASRTHPGRISNEEMLYAGEFYKSEDEDLYDAQVRTEVRDRRGYKIVSEKQWELLSHRYGGVPIKRYCYKDEYYAYYQPEICFEQFNLIILPPRDNFAVEDISNERAIFISKRWTVKEAKERIMKVLSQSSYGYHLTQENFRLWKLNRMLVVRNVLKELELSLIHICRCRRIERCRSRWSPYH
eukprot:TRINITY_DN4801_c0_g1_i3.p1 TRINITY_DN4801_c0_g1~~TRINITY_DN4801_c0_g1_i3.p1  ORF type:complete len:352 (+),score=91.06 TRINITY_DN4801_c0_g1_i3:173-1228(+)